MSAFVPARSKLEAVTRISALTHGPPQTLGPGSKERKSVLVNLAVGLDLNVDTNATKVDLGADIAAAIGASWDESCWSAGQTVTLVGLNRILEAGEDWLAWRAKTFRQSLFEPLETHIETFVPARSKLEAVSRISALTNSPPEVLGPGSKERKSVLVNVAVGLDLNVDILATKPELGGQIAAELGASWDETCWSTGQTITLDGLNLLLRSAEARISHAAGTGFFLSVRDEASALLSALADALPEQMDGRECIEEMQAADYSQWAQDEWVGFYFEFLGLPALVNAFGGGPRQIASTRFDYGLGHTWDLKAHMAHSGDAPLNDQAAMQVAVTEAGGLGFLVLTGQVEYDDGDFKAWQREFRLRHGKKPRKRARPPKYKRKSKTAFRPGMVEAFHIADEAALNEALGTGVLSVMVQGPQVSGRPRAPKYSLNLVKARMSDLLLVQLVL
ncbi:MAG: hypothetical protein M3130_00645 [Actinomycetota bacterium]|nr:hypothetical protein [Actinomycetota bacterium]